MMMIASVAVCVGMFVLMGNCRSTGRAGSVFLSVRYHVNLGSSDPAAVHTRNFQPRTNIQGGDGVLEKLCRHSRIHQRAQKHVTADAGEAIKISNAHEGNQSLILLPL